MTDHRDSTGEGIWIILILVVLLLLAGGGGFMWFRQQRVATARDEMQRAMEQAEAAHRQTAIHEALNAEIRQQAEHASETLEEARSQAEPDNRPTTEEQALAQPLVPELYLSQHLWQYVESLDNAAPDARVFTLDPDSGQLIFGDGQHGAPIPEGPTAIQATYHTAGGGTVTVNLPATDLRTNALQATRSPDGTLHLQLTEPKPPVPAH